MLVFFYKLIIRNAVTVFIFCNKSILPPIFY